MSSTDDSLALANFLHGKSDRSQDSFMLIEPTRSQFDLRFALFGISVRVHPLFWLIAVLLGSSRDAQGIIVWVGVVFVSILIHELGHALMARRFGCDTWIVLYGLGGLAMHQPSPADWKKRIAIYAAGPLAGFILVGFLVVFLTATGSDVRFAAGGPLGIGWSLRLQSQNPLIIGMVWDLFFVNIIWGLVNLLPIYPLDGGRISREAFRRFDGPQALLHSLQLSAIAAGAVAAYSLLVLHELFLTLMFGYLAYVSYSGLQQISGHMADGDGWSDRRRY